MCRGIFSWMRRSARRAYEDTALPIGFGQTISQPYIVARMTEALLAAGPLSKVLEVGTGCGYQTAVLAPLVTKLYSIERIEPLYLRAKLRLDELELRNVRLKHGDGTLGWKSLAPFDGILVAAAPISVPEALLKQLQVGGRLHRAGRRRWPPGIDPLHAQGKPHRAPVTGPGRVRAAAGRAWSVSAMFYAMLIA